MPLSNYCLAVRVKTPLELHLATEPRFCLEGTYIWRRIHAFHMRRIHALGLHLAPEPRFCLEGTYICTHAKET
jgi:hypothetical protein